MRRLRRARQRHVRQQAKDRKKFPTRAVAAGTAAVMALGAAVSLNKALADTPDPHQSPVSRDADADLLANKEELAIGYGAFDPDQNRNQIPDGVELAKRCAADINELPWREEAFPGQTYKWCDFQRGLEICDICGEVVNMGPAGIVNPQLGLSVDCPLIAIHYMEHGSFTYGGDVHNGRLDVPALLRALELRYPYDPNDHQLPLYTDDLDGDLLDDNEELSAGTDLYDADQDDDLTPDGIELAKSCVAVIGDLPLEHQAEPNQTYRVCHELDGLEQCDICGQWIHMGGCAIVNPKLDLTYPDVNDPLDPTFLPDLALHYMEHGSFSCAGSIHTGRVNVSRLLKVLEMPRRCGHLPALYLPGDFNKDCIANFLDFAAFAQRWLECTDPNDDRCHKL